MSLANFFDRAALAASSVLHGFDAAEFGRALESRNVGVLFDDAAVCSFEGRETLQLLTNLLSRLYPQLSLLPHGAKATIFLQTLEALARAINPDITLDKGPDTLAACVIVGATSAHLPCPTLYVGSDGWVVRVSQRSPVGSSDSNNPFGAGAAACFGAANVFRALFSSQLNCAKMDQDWSLSLLRCERDPGAIDSPTLPAIDLGETHLVGLGAVGNATIWALARMPGISGTLTLVDHERVELSNLQRYVLALQSDIDRPKTELATNALTLTKLNLDPKPLRWGEYLSHRNNWHLPLVAVAVDSAVVRRDIQASLPQRIVNAWTQPGNLGVSRHGFIDDQGCLMCLYLPQGKQKNFDQLVTEAIGFPQEAMMEVRNLLYKQTPLNRAFLERIADGLKIDVQPLLPLEGKPLQVFYREAVCGGLILSLSQGASQGEIEVPLAFQSALAGIMLAAEIVMARSGLRIQALPSTTTIDLLKPLGSYLSFPQEKHPSGKCICQDPDFIAAYKAKYGAGQTTR